MTEILETSQEIHDDRLNPVPRWTLDESRLLIAAVKEQPELYDPKNSKWKWYNHTENIWNKLDVLLKKPSGACKERWTVLRTQFRKEYTTKKDESKWKLYKELSFLKQFLYSRGPTLNECIRKAMNGQMKRENEDHMITLMSPPPMPDLARNDNNKENRDNISINQDNSFTMEYHQSERPTVSSRSIAIPKLEPVSMNDFPQHMSTPINPPKCPRGFKRPSSPEDQKNILQIGNVQIKRLAKSSSTRQTEHYTLTQNDEKINGIKCTEIMNVTTLDSHSSINQSIKPFNFSACSCKADADTMFMQSLMPDVKKLKSEERMVFKLRIHNLLQEMLYKKSNLQTQ